jgi:hypothetical protein
MFPDHEQKIDNFNIGPNHTIFASAEHTVGWLGLDFILFTMIDKTTQTFTSFSYFDVRGFPGQSVYFGENERPFRLRPDLFAALRNGCSFSPVTSRP